MTFASLTHAPLIDQVRILAVMTVFARSFFINFTAARAERPGPYRRAFTFNTVFCGLLVAGYLVLFLGPLSLADWAHWFQWLGIGSALMTSQWASFRNRNRNMVTPKTADELKAILDDE